MTRIYYGLYGPYNVKFIEPKNSLGYKYKDAGFALSLLDKIALKNDVDSIAITKELEEEYGLKGPMNRKRQGTTVCRYSISSHGSFVIWELDLTSQWLPDLPEDSHFLLFQCTDVNNLQGM